MHNQCQKFASTRCWLAIVAGCLICLTLIITIRIGSTLDSDKSSVEPATGEDCVVQGAYQVLASLDIPVYFSDLRAAKLMPGSLAQQVRDLVLRFQPDLKVDAVVSGNLSEFRTGATCVVAFRFIESGVVIMDGNVIDSIVLSSGEHRSFVPDEWESIVTFQLLWTPPCKSAIFQRRVVDFGRVTTGSVVNLQIPLKNTRTDLVKVSAGPVPCGCISPRLQSDELRPDGVGLYEVEFDTSGKVGWIEYDLPVAVCFQGKTTIETVRVSGHVVQSQHLSSTEFSVGVRNLVDRVSRTVRCGDGTTFFSITDVACGAGLHCVVATTDEQSNGKNLIFTLECAELGIGRHHVASEIGFTTANGEAHQERVTFSVDVVPDLE